MDHLTVCKKPEKKVAHYYPKGQNGRRLYSRQVHCMQLFYNVSGSTRKVELYQIEFMSRFAGLTWSVRFWTRP